MSILPNVGNLRDDPYNMSQDKVRTVAGFTWVLIIANLTLLVLVLINIWKILIKLGKWRTLPLLFFYIFALFSIVLRLCAQFWQYTFTQFSLTCSVVQPGAQACVGIVQTWMIFELSMRFRSVNLLYLTYAQYILLTLVLIFFCADVVTVSVLLSNLKSYDVLTLDTMEWGAAISYLFLLVFVVMGLVHFDLMRQIGLIEHRHPN